MRPFTAKYTRENLIGTRYLKHKSDTNKPEVGDYLIRSSQDYNLPDAVDLGNNFTLVEVFYVITNVTPKTITVATDNNRHYVDTPLGYNLVRLRWDKDGNLSNEAERLYYYTWMPKSYGDVYYKQYLELAMKNGVL